MSAQLFHSWDISEVSIVGLKNVHYLDKVRDFAKLVETGEALKIDSEVDRVYLDTSGPVEIHDMRLKRKIIVEKKVCFHGGVESLDGEGKANGGFWR